MALGGSKLADGHPAFELLTLGLASLHLDVEVPLLALPALLHLQVERHVLELQQTGSPEGVTILLWKQE